MPVNFALAEAGYPCEEKAIDESTANELKLWLDNTYELYRTYVAWVKNYARKMKRGKYNKHLAIKGIANNFAPRIMQNYKKANGLGTVNKCTKQFLGLEIVDSIEEDIKNEGIEYWLKLEKY